MEKKKTVLYNKDLKWGKIKVTCYGGKGGNGGSCFNGNYGEIRQTILELNEDDILTLYVADNGNTGADAVVLRGHHLGGVGGTGGGATTLYINNILICGASGGNGGDGAERTFVPDGFGRYLIAVEGGYGNPSGRGNTRTRIGADGGRNSKGTFVSSNSSSGKIVVKVLRKLYYCIIKQDDKLYTIKPNMYKEIQDLKIDNNKSDKYKQYGINKLNILLNEYNKNTEISKDKGKLGSGKMFEFNIDSDFNSVDKIK